VDEKIRHHGGGFEMKCNFCGKESRKLKSRRNFPHGKKSKGITTKMCPKCNSKNSEMKE